MTAKPGSDAAMQWRHWMAAAQNGDAAAYRAVLLALQGWLTRYFARRAPPSLIDDLVQETMVAIHNKRHTYLPEQPLLPWVAAIARYKWIDGLRKTTRAAEVELQDTIESDSSAESAAHADGLERLLATLPSAQSAVIRLTKIDGLSIEEAATQTGQSTSLVKVNIHRGLKRMSQLIETMDRKLQAELP